MLPAPPATNGSTPPAAVNPKIDLLSGDDYNSPKADNSLALVHVGEPQQTTPASQQNALVLFDMFSDGNNTSDSVNTQSSGLAGQTNPLTPQVQQQQNFHANGTAPNLGSPQYEQSYAQGTGPAWNGQLVQHQQPPSPAYGLFLFIIGFLCIEHFVFGIDPSHSRFRSGNIHCHGLFLSPNSFSGILGFFGRLNSYILIFLLLLR